jgi:hypothetical protein
VVKNTEGNTVLEKALRHPALLHFDLPGGVNGEKSEHQEILLDSTTFTLIIPMNELDENKLEFWQNLKTESDHSTPMTQPMGIPKGSLQKVGEIQL